MPYLVDQPQNVGSRRDLNTPTAAIFNAHVRDNLNFLYGAPSCRVYHNAAQAITTATYTAVALNSERFDNDTMHNTVTLNSRITATTAGRYLFVSNVEFVANATGIRESRILRGATLIAGALLPVVSVAAVTVLNVATIYSMAAADDVEISVYQSSGGNLNVNSTANYSPEFMAHWLGN